MKHADGLTELFFLKLRCSVIWIKKLDMHRRNLVTSVLQFLLPEPDVIP